MNRNVRNGSQKDKFKRNQKKKKEEKNRFMNAERYRLYRKREKAKCVNTPELIDI